MKLTWRKQWRRPYESNWSVFEKIKQVNHISGKELLIFFNEEYVKGNCSYRNLHTLKGFNLDVLEQAIGINLRNVIESMMKLHDFLIHKSDHKYTMIGYHTHLAYCEHCISNCYHSYLHQFKLVTHCPFHQTPLIAKCLNCHKQIYGNQLSNNLPFCCTCNAKLASNIPPTTWDHWEFDPIIKDHEVLSWIKTIGEISVTSYTSCRMTNTFA